jgi:hypothetical protein
MLFGYSEEQVAWFGLSFGIGAFMLYMVFIIFQLARESKAGRFGAFVLFLALGFGLVGFAAKGLVKYFLGGVLE